VVLKFHLVNPLRDERRFISNNRRRAVMHRHKTGNFVDLRE
jgi:hypothetical protein